MNERLNDILMLLSDGEFHSGSQLGEQLQVSRAAVNQQIKKLIDLGVDVFSVHGKGYRLAHPIELLDAETIAARTGVNANQLDVRSVVTSSNDELKALLKERSLTPGFSILAEAQTAGRGRRGKTWVSPFGTNLYISLYWPLNEGINGAMGLSLVVGIALANALKQLGLPQVGLKWPNDVYASGKKIAGILVDIESRQDGGIDCILGMGINLRMPLEQSRAIGQQWTDVASETPVPLSRNAIAAAIYGEVIQVLEKFTGNGMTEFKQQWDELDIYRNKPVRLLMGERQVEGVCRGVDDNGAILIEQQDNIIRYFGGEISLRPVNVTD